MAVATAEVGREISDLLQFPPARAATGILLVIFKTIQVCIYDMKFVNGAEEIV